MSNKENSIFSPSKQLMADKLVSGEPASSAVYSKSVKEVPSDSSKLSSYVVQTKDGPVDLIPYRRFITDFRTRAYYIISKEFDNEIYHIFVTTHNHEPVVQRFKDEKSFKEWVHDPITRCTMNPITVDGHMVKKGDTLRYAYPGRLPNCDRIRVEVNGYHDGCWVLIQTNPYGGIGHTIVHSKYLFKD